MISSQQSSPFRITIKAYLFIYCLCALALQSHAALTWTLKIPPNEEECFLLVLPVHNWKIPRRLIGNYELIDDGVNKATAERLLAYVMEGDSGEDRILWKSKPNDLRGFFDVAIPVGEKGKKRYWMCVQNSIRGPDAPADEGEEDHPANIMRMVGFTYRLESNDAGIGLLKKGIPWQEENVQDWNAKSSKIEEDLRALVQHHDYMRVRESNHRVLVEKTFADVLQWTVLEASMVVLVAVGQVLYFRRFLENKRYIH